MSEISKPRFSNAKHSRTKRFVALDLDETLLLPDKTVSPRVVAATRKSFQRGVHVVLASARPIHSVAAYMEHLAIEGYCVALNGTVIARAPEVEVVHKSVLDADFVAEVIEACNEITHDNLFIETPLQYAVDHIDEDVSLYIEMTGQRPLYTGDLRKWEPKDVCKVNLRIEGPPDEAAEMLSRRFGDRIHIVTWDGPWSWVEVLAGGTSKATALQWLTDHLGIDREETLAVGDQLNDLEMLQWAGTGVAMGNAHPAAQAVADWVTASNVEDGCAIALERFVLQCDDNNRPLERDADTGYR